MPTVFYKKIGKKYIAVGEYDNDFSNSLGYGDHLLSIYPGGSSRRKIDPAFATVIAAFRYCRDPITSAMVAASDLRPQHTPLTPEQLDAWHKLNAALGDSSHLLTWPSAHDIAESAMDALIKEISVLLLHPAVKNAYDEFMLICKLVKEEQKGREIHYSLQIEKMKEIDN